MSLKWLKDQIVDEVNGAMTYMEKAVEHKGSPHSCTFKRMAEMELEHANALTKMFKDEKKPEGMTDEEYGTTQKAVLDTYIDGMTKFEAMKKLFYQL